MAAPRSSKRRSRSSVRGSVGGPRGFRVAVAVALLGLAVLAVAYLSWRSSRPPQVPAVPDAGEVVRRVAMRLGCDPGRVVAAASHDQAGTFSLVTVHAPKGFPAGRFALDLEAAAHNLGGRLEPRPLGEAGGYGLARLDGEVGGVRWRVLVLSEAPPALPARRTPGTGAASPAGAMLAIVLDDAGASLDILEGLSRLPLTVAVAVLPNAARSTEVARAVGASGRELLLHMPMEPLGSRGPGAGDDAVEVGLPASEIEARVSRALAVVAGARGVNNHMGSRATADAVTMAAVMEALRGRGLYFLDSRTTAETVAEQAARQKGVPALRRDVFLDVVAEPEAIRRALEQAVARARAQGHALAIGHVHPVTLEVLASELPRLSSDVRLVRPSRLVPAEN